MIDVCDCGKDKDARESVCYSCRSGRSNKNKSSSVGTGKCHHCGTECAENSFLCHTCWQRNNVRLYEVEADWKASLSQEVRYMGVGQDDPRRYLREIREYEIISGPLKGQRGVVTDIKQETYRSPVYLRVQVGLLGIWVEESSSTLKVLREWAN